MANEFLPLEILCNKLIEIHHLIQHRLVGLQGLFDGRNQNLFDALGLDHLPFGIATIQESQFIKTYFRCFFGKPFGTVHVLGRRHRHMKPTVPSLFLRNRFNHLQLATLVGCSTDNRLIKVSFAIGQCHFITYHQTKHTQAMARFLFRHFALGRNVGSIKYMHSSYPFSSSLRRRISSRKWEACS